MRGRQPSRDGQARGGGCPNGGEVEGLASAEVGSRDGTVADKELAEIHGPFLPLRAGMPKLVVHHPRVGVQIGGHDLDQRLETVSHPPHREVETDLLWPEVQPQEGHRQSEEVRHARPTTRGPPRRVARDCGEALPPDAGAVTATAVAGQVGTPKTVQAKPSA